MNIAEVDEKKIKCGCCGGGLFVVDYNDPDCGIVWSHVEDQGCDDPDPIVKEER
jgi:hypothetical protein